MRCDISNGSPTVDGRNSLTVADRLLFAVKALRMICKIVE